MWISLYTFLEISLFLSATIYDTTQNFFTILTVWTKIVHTCTASGGDDHCPHCYCCGQNVKNVENNILHSYWRFFSNVSERLRPVTKDLFFPRHSITPVRQTAFVYSYFTIL